MDINEYIKENALSFLGYATLIAGGASLVYWTMNSDTDLFSIPTLTSARGFTSTKQLKKTIEENSRECIILLREVVWSAANDIPKCYLVWRGEPRTVYQYSISGGGLEPITGIYDEMNDNTYYKQLLPILFENGVTYNVKIKDAVSMSSTEINIPVRMIEANGKSARLEYYGDRETLALKFTMNLSPSGFVPKGVNVSIKLGDREQFTLNPEDFSIHETSSGYSFNMELRTDKLNVNEDAIRVEILLFSGGNVCSSYTIERRPTH